MSTRIPNSADKLLSLGLSVRDGLEADNPWLTLPDGSFTDVRSKVADLREATVALGTARSAKSLAANRLAIADKNLKIWLTKARLVVMLARGNQWSESWIHTGFTNRRTQVPKGLEARIALGRALVSFFARHPEVGVPFAEVTAARGRNIYERVVQSCEMLQMAKDECVVVKERRDGAEHDLRKTLKQVVAWLETQFDGSDPRWIDFGLTPTGSPARRVRRAVVSHTSPIPFIHQSAPPRHRVAAA